jgi:hypothetical protein
MGIQNSRDLAEAFDSTEYWVKRKPQFDVQVKEYESYHLFHHAKLDLTTLSITLVHRSVTSAPRRSTA